MVVFFKVKGSECFWEKWRGEWWWWCGVMGFNGEIEVVGVGENLGVEKMVAMRERERERERLLAVKPWTRRVGFYDIGEWGCVIWIFLSQTWPLFLCHAHLPQWVLWGNNFGEMTYPQHFYYICTTNPKCHIVTDCYCWDKKVILVLVMMHKKVSVSWSSTHFNGCTWRTKEKNQSNGTGGLLVKDPPKVKLEESSNNAREYEL